MREPRYSLLADIQYDIELARQGKFALYGQRNIAREYRCKKATPEEQQAYETLQNVLFMVPQWSDTEELHSALPFTTSMMVLAISEACRSPAMVEPFSEEYNTHAAFKKIPLDALKKLPSPMNLICVTPTRIDALFSDFKKDGYSVRQVLHQLA